MPEYKLCVVRPTGHHSECPDIGTWIMDWAYGMHRYPEITAINNFQVANCRVSYMRNRAVAHAQVIGATHCLMLDPDMVIDRFVERDAQFRPVGRYKPFWDVAWPFMKANPGSILGVPYCGMYPERPLHVFTRNHEDKLVRVDHQTAMGLEGWTQVAACGTGMMLIDMRVFDRLEKPYFDDVYKARDHCDLKFTQDVTFCLKAGGAGVPVYVNWDCPAGHWQNTVVDPPWLEKRRPAEQPIPLAKNPSVPALVMQGAGDRSWQ